MFAAGDTFLLRPITQVTWGFGVCDLTYPAWLAPVPPFFAPPPPAPPPSSSSSPPPPQHLCVCEPGQDVPLVKADHPSHSPGGGIGGCDLAWLAARLPAVRILFCFVLITEYPLSLGATLIFRCLPPAIQSSTQAIKL